MTLKNGADRKEPDLKSRTQNLYAILNYNWAIFPCTATIFFLGAYHEVVVPDARWTPDCTVLAMILGPFLLFQLPPYYTLWGLCLPIRPFAYAKASKKRPFRSLKVCLVTKATNVQTVIHTAQHWNRLSKRDRISFHVVVDSVPNPFVGMLPDFVELLEVPSSFRPDHARHKARVLEWCRRHWRLSEEDWVLHLDEETEITEEVMSSCLDFIERGAEDIGMGTIFYDAHNHWKNPLLTVAEALRVAEDFGRFQLPVRLFQRPLLGWMHGSFILINGQAENAVTWDTDCLAEDFWFAYHAAKQGFKTGWIHAVAREQPPESLQDLVRQRRRWYSGIMSVPDWSVRLALAIPMLESFVHLGLAIYIACGWRVSLSHHAFVWLTWNLSVHLHGRVVGCVIQDLDYPGTTAPELIWHVILVVLLGPVVDLIQSVAFCLSLAWPARDFAVIKKC
ncbi:glycosyltransferase family 2 protein [Aspergillus aculeatinus CBS 121060]|uniref:Uncharacterized protein n=1 Tax=Aspergillus aculeatinus CBS 121060 TaxID=1448322 RepID=A0ACD1H2X2_9EURO|nr:hypothetical protein BO66DRAFT_378603 [Aspergillus aculeatinus CBS 121060]RAH67809.1 hypothetical protein BO66DRAFT_378603 [Aspergillus aculeatinus CBS 121060]